MRSIASRMLPVTPQAWSNGSMRIEPRDLVWIALAIALAVALIQTARLWWRDFARAHRLRARMLHAAEGEARAERVLRDAGFDVLASQVAHSWNVRVDGVVIAIDLRADYVVAKNGRRFVAEVKTGRAAPRIDSAATRRQLLEYRCAFDVDGVLLVDADASIVHAIEFDLPSAPYALATPSRGWLGITLALGAALVATLLALR